MEGIETMDLNNNDEGFTPLESIKPAETFEPEKNVPKIEKMDSTPISDVMGASVAGPNDWETSSMSGAMPPQQMPMMMPQQPQQPQAPAKKANPMNLTDEQMEALLAGLVCVIATSKPVQEKLSTMIPQMAEGDNMTSMIVMGLVAAAFFYFGKRIAMP
jgi:hypothetical protein